jgi:pyridoxal phosphate enzyme (YggS family)
MATVKRIEKNLARIRETIGDACARVGRNPNDVRIVAVTKTVDLAAIRSLLEVGICDLGESRAQQLATRAGELDDYLSRARKEFPPVRWHMIGHLQRNKAKSVLNVAHTIHSVDSLRLAEEIDERAEKLGKRVNVMLQVNTAEESQKSGCAVGAAFHLGEMITTLKHLRLTGLMAMAPLSDDLDDARYAFGRLREIFEEMRSEKVGGADFKELSMGMSTDYVAAVEQGATMLRIGTALFE